MKNGHETRIEKKTELLKIKQTRKKCSQVSDIGIPEMAIDDDDDSASKKKEILME